MPIDKTDVGLYDIPTQEIKRGRFHNVPIIIGTDNNEGFFRFYLFVVLFYLLLFIFFIIGALFVLIVPSIFNIDLPFDRQKTIEVATRFWNATVAARVLDLYGLFATLIDFIEIIQLIFLLQRSFVNVRSGDCTSHH